MNIQDAGFYPKESRLDKRTFVELYDGRYVSTVEEKWHHPDLYEMPRAAYSNLAEWMRDDIIVDYHLDKAERLAFKKEWVSEAFGDVIPPLNDEGTQTREFVEIDGLHEGDPRIRIVISKPVDWKGNMLPVLFAIGQGGMNNNSFGFFCPGIFEPLALRTGAACVFVEARTGVEEYMPTPLDDYQAGYQWILDHGAEYGLDADNIVISGDSGGGYMGLCFAFRCKRVGFRPKGLLAREPIIDDMPVTPSSKFVNGIVDCDMFRRTFMTILKEGDRFNPYVPPEIIPARATVEDCRGLCPVYIHTNEHERDRDSAVALAEKLYEAHVFTQLHVWGGAMHAAFFFPSESRIKQVYDSVIACELADMFEYDLRREWLNE